MPNDNIAILRSFLACGDSAFKSGRYATAENFYQMALRFANRNLGPKFPETALANFSLSMFYLDRKMLDDAASFAHLALEVFIGIFGLEHPTTAMALHQLAEVRQAQNLPQIALPIRQRATAILNEHLPQYQRELNRFEQKKAQLKRAKRPERMEDIIDFKISHRLQRLISSDN